MTSSARDHETIARHLLCRVFPTKNDDTTVLMKCVFFSAIRGRCTVDPHVMKRPSIGGLEGMVEITLLVDALS